MNSVAGVLKQFFRDLPEPLFTNQLYSEFIAASSLVHWTEFLTKTDWQVEIDGDITRRDSLHALINRLPDPNYATLRILILVGLFNRGDTYQCLNSFVAFASGPRAIKHEPDELRESRYLLWVPLSFLSAIKLAFHDIIVLTPRAGQP